MKSKLFVLGAATLLLASCSNELDVLVNQAVVGGGTTPLSINVLTNPTTKALVDEAVLPNNSKIGVKLVKSDGTAYDNQTYNNIFYSTTDGTSWTVDDANKILLSATEGKAYAYYPYSSEVSDFTAISISSAADPAQQVDYMYGNEATGLKNSNPTASFTMSHAMSIVNFTIAKGTYTGTGSITSVKMKGNTASNTGTMNAVAGTVTATNNGYEFESTIGLTLGNSSTGKFIVVPSGVTSKLDFKVVMDGQTYTASTTDVKLESGQVYKYTLTMNSTGLTVNTVTVTEWGDAASTDPIDTQLTTLTDGVYAIDNDDKLVAYTIAEGSSDIYKGVALVMNGKAIEIAKEDASERTKWADASLTTEQQSSFARYITTATETTERGYLKMPNGSYRSNTSPDEKIPDDISTWTVGALADLDGEANTDCILAANVTIASVITSFNNGDHGSNDWYLPAAGQLAYMYMNHDKINNLLNRVSGTEMSTWDYWSSSVYSADYAWYVYFDDGLVYNDDVTFSNRRVRLVRNL